MSRLGPIALVALLPGSAPAQDFALREGDQRFDRAGLEAEITGRTLTFFDDGESRFSPGGAYSYTYGAVNGGGTQFATFTVLPEGIVCILYRNGMDRCDMYVRANGRLVVLTEEGERFPVRPEAAPE